MSDEERDTEFQLFGAPYGVSNGPAMSGLTGNLTMEGLLETYEELEARINAPIKVPGAYIDANGLLMMGGLRVIQNQFLPEDTIAVSPRLYKHLKEGITE